MRWQKKNNPHFTPSRHQQQHTRPPHPRPLQGERWTHPRRAWYASPSSVAPSVVVVRLHIAAGPPPPRAHPRLISAAGTRRRNPRFKGIKMKGYCSIYQLFKLSSWVALYKSFMDGNLTKTLFSIDYRGYFIIQAIHLTIKYSSFLHKTDKKRVKTNKIVQRRYKR